MSSPTRPNLREIYCAKFFCSPEDFCRRVFRSCCHHPLLCSVLMIIWPRLFCSDLQLIGRIGLACSLSDIEKALWSYERCMRREQSNWRLRWKLRVSEKRLLDLAGKLMEKV